MNNQSEYEYQAPVFASRWFDDMDEHIALDQDFEQFLMTFSSDIQKAYTPQIATRSVLETDLKNHYIEQRVRQQDQYHFTVDKHKIHWKNTLQQRERRKSLKFLFQCIPTFRFNSLDWDPKLRHWYEVVFDMVPVGMWRDVYRPPTFKTSAVRIALVEARELFVSYLECMNYVPEWMRWKSEIGLKKKIQSNPTLVDRRYWGMLLLLAVRITDDLWSYLDSHERYTCNTSNEEERVYEADICGPWTRISINYVQQFFILVSELSFGTSWAGVKKRIQSQKFFFYFA